MPEIMAGAKSDRLNFYDENGMYDQAKSALYDMKKQGGWDVAVVPLAGVMSRYGMCGRGTEFTAQLLKAAEADSEVGSIVLNVNSPGGTVDSTRMLADVVKNLRKPVVTAGPQMYSAAYFVGSQGREVWLDPQSVSGVGSIGAIYVHVDDSEKKAKEGVKEEPIVSDGSEDKVIYGGYAGMTDELRTEIKSMLAASRREFVGYVRRGRAGKLANDSVLTGKTYRGKAAIDGGLVDQIGTLDEAIKRARKLA